MRRWPRHRAVNPAPAFLFGLGWLALATPAPAGAQVALGAKAGTLGAGLELTAGLSPQWNARFGIAGGSLSDRRTVSDIDYDADADLRSASAWLDWHPGAGGFRLTGGVLYNDSAVRGKSRPSAAGTYNVGGIPLPASQVGTLRARADFDPLAPYVGLGWGNAVAAGGRLRLAVDLGVAFQGKAKVSLTADVPAGSPLATPVGQALLAPLLAAEERDLEDKAADYDLYPVATIGLSYRF